MTTTATSTALKLPPVLADLDLKLARAFSTAVREIWPEGEKFLKAEQPEAIARLLIQTELHKRLVNAKIAYLFREKMEGKLATASKAGGKLAFLAAVDFTIEFNHARWLQLTPEQRIALVDHELAHCERDVDTGVWMMRQHDIEEFSEIVARWGLWTSPLKGFGVAIESAQIELFVPVLAQADDEDPPDDQADEARRRIKRGGK